MNVEKCNLFHTPSSWAEIAAWVDRHPPALRPHLWTAAMLSWNFLAQQINQPWDPTVPIERPLPRPMERHT